MPGIRSVDQAQWSPANFESIPAQAVMCARFTSKARFYLEILDQIIYFKSKLINKFWNNDQIEKWFTPWDTAQSNEYFRKIFFSDFFFKICFELPSTLLNLRLKLWRSLRILKNIMGGTKKIRTFILTVENFSKSYFRKSGILVFQ